MTARHEAPLSVSPPEGRGSQPHKFLPLMPRVEAKLRKNHVTGCWLWQGYVLKGPRGGYGTIHYRGKQWLVHRAVYTELVGEIPDGLVLDHLCETPACCNPEHLEPVTNMDNMLRGPATSYASNVLKTHCPRGHEYSVENTRRYYQPHKKAWARFCKECERERQRACVRVPVACTACEWRGRRVQTNTDSPCPKCSSDLRIIERKEAA